jgi:hypothetical protein
LSIALLAVGLAVRAALYFPPAMFQIDSDAVIAGLCGFRAMHAHYPIFLPAGVRVGAASCYVAAAYFQVFGPSRVGLALTGLTWGALYLLFSLLFLRATLGVRLAPVAYLFAIVPSEQFMTVSYAPWGYGEIMASCAATLWLATLWRMRAAPWTRICFGLSVGVGIWFSLQTLMITVPAIIWIALGRRRTFFGESIGAVPAAAFGAAPFLLGNVASGFPSLTQNSYSQTVSNLSQASANLSWYFSNLLPKLLFRFPATPDWMVLGGAFALVALGFVAVIKRDPSTLGKSELPRGVAQLLGLVFVACALIFSIAAAGSIRGWTVRYVAPLYVVAPIFYGIGIAGLWRSSRALAVSVVATVLIPNLAAYGLPGSAPRAQLTAELADDRRLREILAARNVRLVFGAYVWVYHLNFDSAEHLAGVPGKKAYDYYHYGARLGRAPVRWALLGGLAEVRRHVRSQGAKGELTPVGDLWLFTSNRAAPNAAALIRALRTDSPANVLPRLGRLHRG